MNVPCINSITFKGQIAKTKDGNDYEKSNEGIKYVPVVSALAVISNEILNKKDAIFSSGENSGSKKFGIVVAIAAGALICGAVMDWFIDRRRQKDADYFAQTNKIKPSNSSVKAGWTIFGLLDTLANHIMGDYKDMTTSQKFGQYACGAILGLMVGCIYDHGVDKFREKLAHQSQEKPNN